jgi:Fe-S-cluster-containing hydrogenase component 2
MSEKKKKLAWVDRTLCAACGVCMKVCPKKAITIYKGLYALVEETLCIGCKKCAKECPASIIDIREVDR